MKFGIRDNKNGMMISAAIILTVILFLAWTHPDNDYYLESKMVFGAPGSDIDWGVRAGVVLLIGSVWSWFWSWWFAWTPGWYLLGLMIQKIFMRK